MFILWYMIDTFPQEIDWNKADIRVTKVVADHDDPTKGK